MRPDLPKGVTPDRERLRIDATVTFIPYAAIRAEPEISRFADWADMAFLCGLLAILAAVGMFAIIEG